MKTTTWFSPNGSMGRGAYEEPDFPCAAALVDHLDYLGVHRSLVWHVAARDLNPVAGNRRLVDEIAAGGFEHRLVPAFTVTPACFFERGALDFLRTQFAAGRAPALRIMPEASRFPIREIERVLGELAGFAPAVFWDCGHVHNELNLRDFEHLARTFPAGAFVLTQKMWGGFSAVLDLMWRCPNLYIDSSWLHMRDTLELLVGAFGADRVLFGIGTRSHYGAAVAALAHADIDDEAKEKIAHGNLERILAMPPYAGPELPTPALLTAKPLWNRFRAGKPLEGVEILDAHGHTPPHTRGWIARENRMIEGSAALVTRMDRLGVARLIVAPEGALFGENLAGNREAEEALAPHRGRLYGYLVFNPLFADEMVPAFDDFFSRDFFVGFKLLPSYWKRPVTDPGYAPVWAYADRHRLPILIHTWNDRYNTPSLLKDIAPRHPGAAFLLGHSGGGTEGRLEAEELAQANPNVFLEFCGSFTTPRRFETSMGLAGGDRVIFGSDTAAHDQAWELGRYLSLPLPDPELRPGLAANMRRILAARR